MKTIALFGASGKTGKPFVNKALEKGYKIQALVRNPDNFPIKHPNLTVIKGDILNQNDVNQAITGSDAVISLIGHVKGSPENLQSEAMHLVISAMKNNGIKRLISLTGGGVRDEQNDKPKFIDKLIPFIMKNLAGKGSRNALLDGRAHAEIIRNSGLDWTIVRGPMLTEEPAKGTYQVGNVGELKGIKLTREDLADFILKTLETDTYIHEMPFVVN